MTPDGTDAYQSHPNHDPDLDPDIDPGNDDVFLAPDTAVPPLGGPDPAPGEPRRWRLNREVEPSTPGERAKRLETDGYDPKLGADMRRAAGLDGEAHGCVHNGAWAGHAWPADKALVRGPACDPEDDLGVHYEDAPGIDDDVPPLPRSLGKPLRPRWEAFARLYAFGHSAADAARHAGYAWDSAAQAGWRLLQDERVRDRVAHLQQYHADALSLDPSELRVRAEAIYREAMNRGHYTAAIRAIEFLRRPSPGEGEGGPASLPETAEAADKKCLAAPLRSAILNSFANPHAFSMVWLSQRMHET